MQMEKLLLVRGQALPSLPGSASASASGYHPETREVAPPPPPVSVPVVAPIAQQPQTLPPVFPPPVSVAQVGTTPVSVPAAVPAPTAGVARFQTAITSPATQDEHNRQTWSHDPRSTATDDRTKVNTVLSTSLPETTSPLCVSTHALNTLYVFLVKLGLKRLKSSFVFVSLKPAILLEVRNSVPQR